MAEENKFQPSGRRTIRSAEISSKILKGLQELNGAGTTEIAEHLGHSKSTIHDHLYTLDRAGLIVRTNNGFRLSIRFLDMAEHVKKQFGNYEVIARELDDLANETQEVAQFGVEEHNSVRYLYKKKGKKGVDTASRVGTQQPLHSTSLGKAILAHYPLNRVEEIIDGIEFERRTGNTITTKQELLDELEETRHRGYAIDDEENLRGIRCIAAPVIVDDEVVGAVSLTGPASRFSGELFEEKLPETIKRTTNVIEINSMYSN